MEVHHHPHVEKKSFKEYLLEGLMIFLAVSMGFFAESIREHITESKHEVEYMKSLVNDLQLDTAYFAISNETRDTAISASRTLLRYFKANPSAARLPVQYHFLLSKSNALRMFINHSGTIDQLKSSGSIRLVRNKEIVDSIESYYNQIKRIDNLNNIYLSQQQVANELVNKLVVAKDNINNYDSLFQYKKDLPASTYFSLNDAYLNEYINYQISRLNANINGKKIHQEIMNKAIQLMNKIKKEYDFEK
jgi:hypothetical protein